MVLIKAAPPSDKKLGCGANIGCVRPSDKKFGLEFRDEYKYFRAKGSRLPPILFTEASSENKNY